MSDCFTTNHISNTNIMEQVQEQVLKEVKKRWEAKVSTTLTNATPDQIFPLLEDFFGLNKWFPGLHTCHGISGVNGEIGCIRYCSGGSLPPSEDGVKVATWSKERLIAISRKERSLSYDMVDSNIGFKSYVSTLKIVDGEDGNGCVIEWKFGVDPVQGWRLEDLVKKYEVGLKSMANKMMRSLVNL